MRPWQKRICKLLAGAFLVTASMACSSAPADRKWPSWEGFKNAFVSADGRVVDHSQPDLRTVSEGQAYALFLALVAGDRQAFDLLLRWTENNLSAGDMGKQLPAWHWGKTGNSWGVIDSNSASDADLWIAYALLEAGRVWCHAPYADKARTLGELILARESMEVEGLGLAILPGQDGFVMNNNSVKLNPSYFPPFMMAQFARAWAEDARWARAYLASQQLLLDTGATGSHPDWVLYANGQTSLPADEQRGDYDAIRTYLWIGLSNPAQPTVAALLKQLLPTARLVAKRQNMPEWFEPATGKFSPETGPPGFQAAVAPFLRASGMTEDGKKFHARSLKSTKPGAWLEYGYYNSVLNLFSQAHMDGLYQFGPSGEFMPHGKPAGACE